MKDAFGKKLELGDKILYSVSNSGGTQYVIGTISLFHPYKNNPEKSYCPPDRVSIKVIESNRRCNFSKDPIIYCSNVVKL